MVAQFSMGEIAIWVSDTNTANYQMTWNRVSPPALISHQTGDTEVTTKNYNKFFVLQNPPAPSNNSVNWRWQIYPKRLNYLKVYNFLQGIKIYCLLASSVNPVQNLRNSTDIYLSPTSLQNSMDFLQLQSKLRYLWGEISRRVNKTHNLKFVC